MALVSLAIKLLPPTWKVTLLGWAGWATYWVGRVVLLDGPTPIGVWLAGVALLGLTAGVVAEDLTHTKTLLWRLLRKWTFPVHIDHIVPVHRTGDNREWIELTGHMRFTRRLESTDLSLEVVRSPADTGGGLNATVVLWKGHTMLEGEPQKFPILKYPLNPQAGYWVWGDGSIWAHDPNDKSVVTGAKYLVTVVLHTAKATYRHRLHIDVPFPKSHAFGKVTWVREDDEIFP